MYLEYISIKNFKAVKNMEFAFTPGVNLLIGDNGVGKTSILEAIAVALSGMLKGIPGVPAKNILQDDIRFSLEERGEASTGIHYWTPSEIYGMLRTEEEGFQWKRFRMDENGNARTKMEDDGIVKWMQKISNDSNALLPSLLPI